MLPQVSEKSLLICEVLQKASPASLSALVRIAKQKKIKKGNHLFWDKESVKYLYFVMEGQISLYKQSANGEKKVIFVYGSGNMLNEVMLQDLPASINCEAFSDSLVLYFPIKEFEKVLENDYPLCKAVMDSMATKIRRLYRQMKNTTGSLRGDKRIAAKLWKLSQDHGTPCQEGVQINLELTITYLADMLGSKRETVSRQLRLLSDEGLLIQNGKYFIIPNRNRLMEYFKAP
ncbi:CRP/FNR family cyclic AMP-dependent transcriptional regulator [Aequitasia blattaphilus]|uniref:Crp/Fnr family transcriptional regulator n=1 Tax=Aequitasia blattaphilus TaxID=2949332 RepID=A0ABT1ECA2_9FIRM|nr:Crp/Fnr family transcriptional regulator [Aequitasia blattaphilus]MCP1103468.1 Crp/Fnr family transcriptional regulator [Aequitasia blattaphilus]MCR8616108.1 Crp/Fnr family transcriptional regulator [Aequitasia blattaphilus]